MFDTISGLPIHPLVVHFTVAVPLAAAPAVALAALWPRFRAWAGPLPLALSLLALVLVPVTTQSGTALEESVKETALVERHAELGGTLLPWVAALAAGAAALYWLQRRGARSGGTGGGAPSRAGAALVVAVLVALAGAVGTGVQTVRIGHSGAEAAWTA
ncbi:hypothetical protein KBZ10_20170 [Streptomyces sp. F63]|uniref:DUF2231 domain-containing protein n=1 Tax=Streptomyces sp. F63 TaxID=2824887 RepID=UPI001B35CEAA|nr:DUF2231 domain-containing protein [Streptomyces sp. F63]MBQ0986786.1 hypothetical protein [Streptomyces sp. F63]